MASAFSLDFLDISRIVEKPAVAQYTLKGRLFKFSETNVM